MLNTMTHATFKYKGYTVYAKRLIDKVTGKDFGWAGEVATTMNIRLSPSLFSNSRKSLFSS